VTKKKRFIALVPERTLARDECCAAFLQLDDAVIAYDAWAPKDDVRMRIWTFLVAADGRQALLEVVECDPGA
jgi:hypothetical protein